ncbi:hypothetical protein EVAR_76294_1 [Eumeta japonica]|uniref:Uncharacterized protein n=1 Tax=Eumeta variegata TaxID=151549 RepID=A0A4C1UPD9_EUMVA|nr:hypothetical protein EVAR_76294_1 [Eumeta japonica]
MQHENGSARPVRYHTFIEYRSEVTVSTVASRPARNIVLHLSVILLLLHQISYSYTNGQQCTIDSSAIVRSSLPMDRQMMTTYSDGSQAYLPLKHAIKEMKKE